MKVEYIDVPVRDKTVGAVRVTFGNPESGNALIRMAYITRVRDKGSYDGVISINVLSLAWPIMPPIVFQSQRTEIAIIKQWKAFRSLYRFARGDIPTIIACCAATTAVIIHNKRKGKGKK